MVLNHSAIPKREIVPAWRVLLGKTCLKNFTFWVGPLKVSHSYCCHVSFNNEVLTVWKVIQKDYTLGKQKWNCFAKKSSCTFQVTGPSTRKIPNSIHKQNSNKKKDRQLKSNLTKQRLFLSPNSRENKHIYKTLIQPTIQYRRSSLTFSNLTHSSFLIKSKSITLRIVTYNKKKNALTLERFRIVFIANGKRRM